jgi:hypothetical protein
MIHPRQTGKTEAFLIALVMNIDCKTEKLVIGAKDQSQIDALSKGLIAESSRQGVFFAYYGDNLFLVNGRKIQFEIINRAQWGGKKISHGKYSAY